MASQRMREGNPCVDDLNDSYRPTALAEKWNGIFKTGEYWPAYANVSTVLKSDEGTAQVLYNRTRKVMDAIEKDKANDKAVQKEEDFVCKLANLCYFMRLQEVSLWVNFDFAPGSAFDPSMFEVDSSSLQPSKGLRIKSVIRPPPAEEQGRSGAEQGRGGRGTCKTSLTRASGRESKTEIYVWRSTL